MTVTGFNAGSAYVQVVPSLAGFSQKINAGTTRAAAAAGTESGKSYSSRFGAALKVGATLGATFAVYKGAQFLKSSIDEASDLNESLNAVNVTYGKNAKSIQGLGRDAATSLGLSNTAFNSLAVQFSAFSKTIAGRGGDVVGTLDDITTRASDFASVMNLEVNEATQLFQSGLAGETEPLRRFGIDLSAAAVQQFAYANGIAKTGEELTESQKVQARYASLMKQTAQTQGDFRNTSDELANSQRIMNAEFDNAEAKIGKAFLPITKDLVHVLAKEGVPALDAFGGWLEDIIPPTGRWLKQLGQSDEVHDFFVETKELADVVGDLAVDAWPALHANGKAALEVLGGGVKIVGALADGFEKMPVPLQRIVILTGTLAATGTISRVGRLADSFGVMATNLRDAETRGATLGRGLRTGALGLGLASAAASLGETNDALSAIEQIGGFAAIGFGVGGGVGALIGAAAGGMFQLGKATGLFGEEAKDAKPEVADFSDTLTELTGAVTASTRALVASKLEEQGLLQRAAKFGISGKTLVDAIVGTPADQRRAETAVTNVIDRLQSKADAAQARLTELENRPNVVGEQAKERQEQARAIQATIDKYNGQIEAVKGLGIAVDDNRAGLEGDIAQHRREREAITGEHLELKKLRELLKTIPPDARTEIAALGVDATRRDVIDIAEQYKSIDDKELQALIEVLGLDKAKRDVSDFAGHAERTLRKIHDERVDLILSGSSTEILRSLSSGPGRAMGVPLIGNAAGGPIPWAMGAKANKDSVHVLAMPDEHMWTTAEVKGAGGGDPRRGHKVLFAMRRMALRGELSRHGDLQPFALGGPVGVGIIPGVTDTGGFDAAASRMSAFLARIAAGVESSISAVVNRILTVLPGAGQLGPGGRLTPAQMLRGQQFARAQVGKPYLWGGVGPNGYDCSGFQSAILNSAMGMYPYSRRGSTGTMPWPGSAPGAGRYSIGWSPNVGNSGIGHTSGNIGGLNVESYGGHGPATGSGARSPLDPMFTGLMHYDGGGVLPPNGLGANRSGRPEAVLTHDQWEHIRKLIQAVFVGGRPADITSGFLQAHLGSGGTSPEKLQKRYRAALDAYRRELVEAKRARDRLNNSEDRAKHLADQLKAAEKAQNKDRVRQLHEQQRANEKLQRLRTKDVELEQKQADKAREAADRAAQAYADAQRAAIDRAKGIRSSITGLTDLSTAGNATGLIRQLKSNIRLSGKWSSIMHRLAAHGLRGTIFNDLVEEGPSAESVRMGQSLLQSGDIDKVVSLQSRLSRIGARAGADIVGRPHQRHRHHRGHGNPHRVGDRDGGRNGDVNVTIEKMYATSEDKAARALNRRLKRVVGTAGS